MTPRQARFEVLFIATGGNATQAAIQAGYTKRSASTQATRLLAYDEVKQRIGELQAKRAVQDNVTVDTLRDKFERCYDGAMAVGQFAAAVSAQQSVAKLYGLLSDRVFVHEVQKFSDDDLVALVGGDDPDKRLATRRLLASPDGFATPSATHEPDKGKDASDTNRLDGR